MELRERVALAMPRVWQAMLDAFRTEALGEE